MDQATSSYDPRRRSSHRPPFTALAVVLVLLACVSTAHAQAILNPKTLSFVPSADHSALDSGGQPIVTSYDFEIYQQGATQPVKVANIGKPAPAADGYIYVDLMSVLGTPPATGVTFEGRVAAIGPAGRGESGPSNPFSFDAPLTCSPSVTPTSLSSASAGGTATVSVAVAVGCAWQVTSALPWVTVASGASGSGSANVTLAIAANTATSPRSGSVLVAGQTVAITQDAAIVPNQPPSVQLTSPAAGAKFTAPASLSITATANDADGTIARVEFYANNALVGTASASPFAAPWNNVAAGSYSLKAVATDNIGAQTTSAIVSVVITAPNHPPTVQVTSPVAGAQFSSPATIALTAAAADSDGSVSIVRYYANDILVGSATASPYSFTWTNVAAGSYTVVAKAVDNSGAETASPVVSITVKAPNMVPSVSLTSPAAGQTFTAGSTIGLSATASDSDGTITSVQFLVDGAVVGTDTATPYTFGWSNATAGTHVITAVATDNAGAKSGTSGVTVTVVSPPNVPPMVQILSPSTGATFTAPASITLSASASDADGTVSRVDFVANGTVIGTKTMSPFTFAWTNVAAGNYTLTGVAVDNNGASTTSAPVSLFVAAAPATSGPNVGIVSPATGTTLSAPANINIEASASDPDGAVTRVDFIVNGTVVGWSTMAPYRMLWNVRNPGNYTITAAATDSQGMKKTSAPVTVSVKKKGGRK